VTDERLDHVSPPSPKRAYVTSGFVFLTFPTRNTTTIVLVTASVTETTTTDTLEPAQPRTMAEMAKQIIRQQWPRRHDPDPWVREQAISLIKTHVVMLRYWRKTRDIAA